MTVTALLKKPSAWVPLALSAAALAVLLSAFAHNQIVYQHPIVRQPDEGAAAHLWQLCIGLEVPAIAIFVARWLGAAPKQALAVLALQLLGVLASAAPVAYFRL